MIEYDLPTLENDFSIFEENMLKVSVHFAIFLNVAGTGAFRFEELTELDRFSLQPDNSLLFQPGKGNNQRYFEPGYFIDEFYPLLTPETWYFNRIDYHTMCRYFSNYWPRLKVTIGENGKSIKYYLCRHGRIKQQYDNGMTVQEISNWLGEVDNKNTEGYINSRLFYIDR